jgi:hypothetical protein
MIECGHDLRATGVSDLGEFGDLIFDGLPISRYPRIERSTLGTLCGIHFRTPCAKSSNICALAVQFAPMSL